MIVTLDLTLFNKYNKGWITIINGRMSKIACKHWRTIVSPDFKPVYDRFNLGYILYNITLD